MSVTNTKKQKRTVKDLKRTENASEKNNHWKRLEMDKYNAPCMLFAKKVKRTRRHSSVIVFNVSFMDLVSIFEQINE